MVKINDLFSVRPLRKNRRVRSLARRHQAGRIDTRLGTKEHRVISTARCFRRWRGGVRLKPDCRASCPACQAHPRCLGGGAAGQPAVVYADETGWKQGGRRVWLWVFTNLRETVYEILPGRGFEQAASACWGKTTRALDHSDTRGRRLGPLPLLQGSRRYRPATTICCTVATSYWRRPRAGRYASHAWSRPSSGTPSPCAIGAMLARSARMACALPRDSSRRR